MPPMTVLQNTTDEKNLTTVLDGDHYVIRTTVKPPDITVNRLHQIESKLELHFDLWPGGKLVPLRDTAYYTCRSTSTSVGPGVESKTLFRVHYPPRNISVTPK